MIIQLTKYKSITNNDEVFRKVMKIIEKAGKPVSIDYVAHHLGVGWNTARAILFMLAMEDKIVAIDTTKSWIFILKGDIVSEK